MHKYMTHTHIHMCFHTYAMQHIHTCTHTISEVIDVPKTRTFSMVAAVITVALSSKGAGLLLGIS